MGEYIVCPNCRSLVFDDEDSIFCDICKCWHHLQCTKLNLKTLKFLGSHSAPWFCEACLLFPFTNSSNIDLLKTICFNSCELLQNRGMRNHCGLHIHKL
jgi:hypothetical protein